MGRFLTNQDFHAKRKGLTMELLKGKEIATRLQTLLRNPAQESDRGDIVLDSARQLASQILRSFTGTISALSSCDETAQIPTVKNKKAASPWVKERRGCYKRRRTSDSWVTISPTKEDGFAWRKYGQKVIMSSKHPRCYFRCTHKSEGCKATKQVQRTKDDGDPIMYQTTYYSRHTCTETPGLHHHQHVLIVDSDPMEMDPNLISFQSSDNTLLQDQYSPNPISTVVQQEFREDNGLSDQDFSSNEAKSTLQDINIVASCFDNSCGSTSLHMLDMEVNELGDIDYSSLYFD